MLALISHIFIWIQNGDIFAISNHMDVLPSTKFAPLIFCLLSMWFPMKNHHQCATHLTITCDFSVDNTMIVKVSPCVPTRQDLQGFIFPLQLDKMESFSSSWLKKAVEVYFAHLLFCLCVQMVNKIKYCT